MNVSRPLNNDICVIPAPHQNLKKIISASTPLSNDEEEIFIIDPNDLNLDPEGVKKIDFKGISLIVDKISKEIHINIKFKYE